MTLDTRMEPIELTDDELKAVAGGQFQVTQTNSSAESSFFSNSNNSGNVTITNSTISNSTA